MTKASEKELETVLDRMSVQSILDMKENFKEVSYRALDKLNKDCVASFAFYGIDTLCGCCFIFDAGDVYNLVTYTTTAFAKMKDEAKFDVKSKLKMLQDKEINAIVYIGANQVLSLLYSVGFVPNKKVKGHYKLLSMTNNG
jgi:hypothetical protein